MKTTDKAYRPSTDATVLIAILMLLALAGVFAVHHGYWNNMKEWFLLALLAAFKALVLYIDYWIFLDRKNSKAQPKNEDVIASLQADVKNLSQALNGALDTVEDLETALNATTATANRNRRELDILISSLLEDEFDPSSLIASNFPHHAQPKYETDETEGDAEVHIIASSPGQLPAGLRNLLDSIPDPSQDAQRDAAESGAYAALGTALLKATAFRKMTSADLAEASNVSEDRLKDDAPPLILEEVAALLHAVGLDLGTMFHDAVDAMVAANEGV